MKRVGEGLQLIAMKSIALIGKQMNKSNCQGHGRYGNGGSSRMRFCGEFTSYSG
jgi:hypothetical protein